MKKYFFLLLILVLTSIYYFLRNPMDVDKNSSLVSINKTEFGTLKNGTVVDKYTLENKIGTKVSIITYGGIITNLRTCPGVKPIDAAASFCPLVTPIIPALTHSAIKVAVYNDNAAARAINSGIMATPPM